MPDESPAWTQDPRWALALRVVASPAFKESRRLSAFLLFVVERVVRAPGCAIPEADIRTHVFGQPVELQVTDDTLVRVQASHLRRRLAQHFALEGATEAVVIEMPRGAYVPVFRERRVSPSPRGRWPRARAFAALAVGCVACVLAYWAGLRSARDGLAASDAPLGGGVQRLWRQMFEDRRVSVIVGDATLTLLQDAARYQLSLPEYQRHEFGVLAAERFPEAHRPWGWRLMNREFTGIGDAGVVARVSAVNALQGRATEVVHARDTDAGRLRFHDVVLVGPRRANPWVDLFELHLNFRTRFEEEKRRCWFENVSPGPGEAGQYAVEWNHAGYCRVAYLPNLAGTGTTLLISGTDMSSIDAGAELVTSERRVQELFSALRVQGGRIPHFEVLLRVKLVLAGPVRSEIVAHRRKGS